MTLARMRQRIQRFESHDNITMSGVTGAIDDDINEALRDLYLDEQWFWQKTEETVAASADATELTMATAPEAIRFVQAPDEVFLEARDYYHQEQYAAKILSKGLQTYSVKGVDSSGFIVLGIRKPAQAGNYRIGIIAGPTALTSDTDTPDGPELVPDFLVRYARYLRLVGDKERRGLMDRALLDAERIRKKLKRMNDRIMRNEKKNVVAGVTVDA